MRTVIGGVPQREPVTVREGKPATYDDQARCHVPEDRERGCFGKCIKRRRTSLPNAATTFETAEAINQEPFTADDHAVIADFLRRLGNPAEPTQPPERNANPEAGEAEPARSEANQTKETKS